MQKVTSLPSHAVMFHHFHDDVHPVGQGSITANQFNAILDWLEARYTILSPDEFCEKLYQKTLGENDICLTFDDGLLCQFDIAIPVLKARALRAFFFIYSAPMKGQLEMLEVYRYFRSTQFESVYDFYAIFFEQVRCNDRPAYQTHLADFESVNHLGSFSFYSWGDRWFRYLRDIVLGPDDYHAIMAQIMKTKCFDPLEIRHHLWMTNENLQQIRAGGHTIGLHSYSHPTTMHWLTKADQHEEYSRNMSHLNTLFPDDTILSMSHPCGQYNEDTLSVLSELGVTLGFRSNLEVKDILSPLEVPRRDHADVLAVMRQ